jgi:N-acetylneuraminate synthase
MEALNIYGRQIGKGHPPFFIAEIGSNHNGDMRLARKLIDEAVAAGADAVKFQSWTKDSLVCKEEYERNT